MRKTLWTAPARTHPGKRACGRKWHGLPKKSSKKQIATIHQLLYNSWPACKLCRRHILSGIHTADPAGQIYYYLIPGQHPANFVRRQILSGIHTADPSDQILFLGSILQISYGGIFCSAFTQLIQLTESQHISRRTLSSKLLLSTTIQSLSGLLHSFLYGL